MCIIKLYKKRFRTDTGKFNFANRVIDEWNVLPSAVVEVLVLIYLRIVWIVT